MYNLFMAVGSSKPTQRQEMSNDTIYVLSATYNSPEVASAGGSMYLKGRNTIKAARLDEICMELTEAKVFYSRQEAWNWREDAASSGWQITPISAKKLFTEKLKGK